LPNNVSGQRHFKNRISPFPQVPVAYSVHVGEKIAHFHSAGVKNNFSESSVWHESAHDARGMSLEKHFGVKTRCSKILRADITRKINRGLKSFPLRKRDSCR
jgi:hypothetical protein